MKPSGERTKNSSAVADKDLTLENYDLDDGEPTQTFYLCICSGQRSASVPAFHGNLPDITACSDIISCSITMATEQTSCVCCFSNIYDEWL